MRAAQTEAKRWLRQAMADLEVVRTLVAAGHAASACFFSQQAAEKALKAVLYGLGSRVVLGHSVRDLAQQCTAHDTLFVGVAAEAAVLDQFYIPTRYPYGLPSPSVPSESYTASQAEEAEAIAVRVVQAATLFLRDRLDVIAD